MLGTAQSSTTGRLTPRQEQLVPVTERLRERVLTGMHLGTLTPGVRLPSVRDLCKELGADPRTVVEAYHQLKEEGLVQMRERSGIYVAAPPQWQTVGPPVTWLATVLSGALRQHVPAHAFVESLRCALDSVSVRALVLADSDDLLWSISRELEHNYGFDVLAADVVDTAACEPATYASRVPDLIVTTTFCAPEARKLGKRLNCPVCAVTMCCDLYKRVRACLHERDVFFIVADARLAERLHLMFAPHPRHDRFHVLVHGRDDYSALPADAVLYLTQLTRKRMLEGKPQHTHHADLCRRSLPEAGVFSDESATELLSFMVRANLSASQASTQPS